MNRQDRRAARRECDPSTKIIALEVYRVIKDIPSLYRFSSADCRTAVQLANTLRQRPAPEDCDCGGYSSLRGHQVAAQLSGMTAKDLLAVFITPEGDQFQGSFILSGGHVMTNRSDTQAEVENAAHAVMHNFAKMATPAPDYVPPKNADKLLQITVNDMACHVPSLLAVPDVILAKILEKGMALWQTDYDGLLAINADQVLTFGVEERFWTLTILANCGWNRVSRDELENFCAMRGIDIPQ